MTFSKTVDAHSLIDNEPIGRWQVLTFFIATLVAGLDGLNTQIVGYVAMNIAKEWHISMANVGTVFGIGMAGTVVGALTLGTMGDMVGLKRMLIIITLVIGCATLATGFATNWIQLMILRFLTGLGVGGAMPNLIAVAAQFAPSRSRASMITITACGFPLGATLGGVLVAGLVGRYGWRSVFIIGGCLSLLLAPLIVVGLPESIPLLLKRTNVDAQTKVRKILRRMFPNAFVEGQIVWSGVGRCCTTFPLLDLFLQGPVLFFALAAAFFMSMLGMYLLSNWLPSLLQQTHSTAKEAVLATAGFNFGGIAGAVMFGRLMDRFGSIRSLAVGYLFGAASIVLLAANHFSFQALALAAFAAGLAMIGCQGGLNALPALLYPDDMRAAATGAFVSIGRVGSILGPLFAGFLLAAHWRPSHVLLAAAIPALCASAFLFALFILKRQAADAKRRKASCSAATAL
jgi:AAHS family 4-hydroxybenzoate transporter-like MFS transporter